MNAIEYIRANGIYYRPMPKGVHKEGCWDWVMEDVCIIKRLFFGVYRIDYYDPYLVTDGYGSGINQTPNARIMLYPSGIQEIKYKLS